MPTEPIIDDDPRSLQWAYPPGVERGLIPRDYREFPVDMFAPPSQIKLIPRSEWSDRIKESEQIKSRLSDIRGNIPSLDQGQNGYCWSHSVTHCVVLNRAVSAVPYVPLSAYMVAAIIKRGRNEGGWCGLAAEFMRNHGVCSQALWPQGNRSLSLDTPEVRADAATRKITEDWVDLTRQVYDQNLTFDMVASLLLSGVPCALDFNWWSHSVCGVDLVEVERGSFGVRIWNSWADSWGERGMGILRGSKAIPDGAIAVRVTGPVRATGDTPCLPV